MFSSSKRKNYPTLGDQIKNWGLVEGLERKDKNIWHKWIEEESKRFNWKFDKRELENGWFGDIFVINLATIAKENEYYVDGEFYADLSQLIDLYWNWIRKIK